MQHEFQRVAIVNRGEAAMRFIHAAREFNQEYDTSLRTIALYTEPDRHAMFVCEADEALSLGPALIKDPATGQSKSSYVDYDLLQRALTAVRAEAVWVGWGFVAEHAQFADLCRDLGIVFIGPDGDVMRRAERNGFVRLANEHRMTIGIGVERDGAERRAVLIIKFACRMDEARRGFTAVDDSDSLKLVWHKSPIQQRSRPVGWFRALQQPHSRRQSAAPARTRDRRRQLPQPCDSH